MNSLRMGEGEAAECAEGDGSRGELRWEEILSHPGTHGDEGPRLQICSQTSTLAWACRGCIKHA